MGSMQKVVDDTIEGGLAWCGEGDRVEHLSISSGRERERGMRENEIIHRL